MSFPVVGTGKMLLGFTDMSFLETVKNVLANWFSMDIMFLPEVCKLMGLKESRYVIEEQEFEQTHVTMLISSSREDYKLSLWRGDMVNPYPTWILIDQNNQLRICFSVEMKPIIKLISTMNSAGEFVDL